MELLFTIIKYFFIGLFGLVGLLIVLTILFGKKVHKHWDYETKFLDNGRERGEFDAEYYRIEGETEDRLDIKCKLNDPRLLPGMKMQVYLDGRLVMQGNVEKEGRLYLGKNDLVFEFSEPAANQLCELKYNEQVWYSGKLYED